MIGSSARFHPELAVKPIVDSAGAKKPIAACLVPDAPDALAMLSEAGVPNFRTPEACADAIAAALKRRPPRPAPERIARPAPGPGRMLDEIDAGTLIERFGIPRAPAIVVDAGVTRAPALPFAYPVVVKALSAEIAHKTEAGGVVLGVADGNALLAAIRQIRANVAQRRPQTRILRVLVQPMVAGIGEALIGYRVDPAAGPLVMVAAGGILDRVYRDRSLRLAPVDLADGQGDDRRGARPSTALAIASAAAPLLMVVHTAAPFTELLPRPEPAARAGRSGDRRRTMIASALACGACRLPRPPKGDLDALADAIVAMSRLAQEPSIVEAEINPLIVRSDGVVAVDALVKLA